MDFDEATVERSRLSPEFSVTTPAIQGGLNHETSVAAVSRIVALRVAILDWQKQPVADQETAVCSDARPAKRLDVISVTHRGLTVDDSETQATSCHHRVLNSEASQAHAHTETTRTCVATTDLRNPIRVVMKGPIQHQSSREKFNGEQTSKPHIENHLIPACRS